MKILFVGDDSHNSGPGNVNKEMIKNLTEQFTYIKSRNRYLQIIEMIFKCLYCKVAVVSGVSKKCSVVASISKKFRKKVAYIMHGCVAYESEIEHRKDCEAGIKQESELLKLADLLLPVSMKYSDWVKNRYPQYAYKTKYLFNGIKLDKEKANTHSHRQPGSVIAIGGDHPIKNNHILSRAVENMKGSAKLSIYGRIRGQMSPEEFKYTEYKGVVPHSELMDIYTKTELFVLNSVIESFSLSVIDALNYGCSVLVSAVAGVTDLLELEENDLIYNPMDIEEIQRKIAYLQKHPNNERLLSKFDAEKWSYPQSVARLENMCKELVVH